MAEWQQNELKGKTDIAYLIASHADGMKGSIEPEDIELWPLQHGFTYDHLLLDEGRVLFRQRIDDRVAGDRDFIAEELLRVAETRKGQ